MAGAGGIGGTVGGRAPSFRGGNTLWQDDEDEENPIIGKGGVRSGGKGRASDLDPDLGGAVEIGVQEEGRLMIILALMMQLMR